MGCDLPHCNTATEELVSGCRREPKAGRWNRRGQGGDLDVCVRMHALNRARNNQQQQSPQVIRKYMDYSLLTTATNSPRSGPLATSCDRCRLAHAERRPRHKYSVNISWNPAGSAESEPAQWSTRCESRRWAL